MQVESSFSTGSDLLDLVVGGGQRHGYPIGRIVNVVGDKSSGKTFLGCELIAAARFKWKDKLRWVYDDSETGFTFDTEALYGFKIIPSEEERVKSRTVEEWYSNFREFLEDLETDEVGIYVLDTLDGLSSTQIQERGDERYNAFKKGKKFEKGSYQMEAAKFLSQEFFKNLTDLTEQKNVLLVVISQTRDKIDSMFNEQTRSGGRALDFYAHTCLWLSTLQKIIRKGRAVGVLVKAGTKKSKTPRPFRSTFLSLLFDYGVDNIGSSIDYLFDLRTDQGALKSSSEVLRWTDSGEEISPKALVQFITERGKEDLYRQAKKSYNLTGVRGITEWIAKDPELQKEFEIKFGVAMKREDLIDWVEANSKQAELTERVRAKWEAVEQEIRTNRPRKYG